MADNFPDSPSAGQPDGPKITVVGSINMDLVVRAGTIPVAGQTVLGHSLATVPGGKGANQAVAAARCQGRVRMIGRVGNDDFGHRMIVGLQANGVETSGIMVSEAVATGAAIVMVDDNGENSICLAGGANLLLKPADIEEQLPLIAQADVVLLQLEIPIETAVHALELAHRHGVPVILNPAPAPGAEQLDPKLYSADVLIPNEDEAARLSGEPITDVHTAKLAASALVTRGARTVVVTLGRRGALAITAEELHHIPPFCAKIVDSTGAGDAFCGAFTVAYARKFDLHQATRFAAAAGALACNKFGAQPSMPHLDAIMRLVQRSC